IPLIWNKAIAFQQFQRYAHAESSLDEYVGYLARHVSAAPRALAMYGNDAEIFDFRPGRYRTESALAGDSEWDRIEQLYATLARDDRFQLVRPSDVLELAGAAAASCRLQLESAHDPTPVKKQRKYNLTRWAVTGRDDIGINTACWRAGRGPPVTRTGASCASCGRATIARTSPRRDGPAIAIGWRESRRPPPDARLKPSRYVVKRRARERVGRATSAIPT